MDAGPVDGGQDAGTVDPGLTDGGPDGLLRAPPLTCGELAPATGTSFVATTTAQLLSLAGTVSSGDTILLMAGTYVFQPDEDIDLESPGVTLRGATGDRTDVVLTHDPSVTSADALIEIHASDVTVAHLTLRRLENDGIEISPSTSGADVVRTRIHDVLFEGVLDNSVVTRIDVPYYSDYGTVSCSTFRATATQQSDAACEESRFILTLGSRGWLVRDNRFEDLYCTSGSAQSSSLRFSDGSRDIRLERNVFLNMSEPIFFGTTSEIFTPRAYADDPCDGAELPAYGGVVLNNFFAVTRPAVATSIGGVQRAVGIGQVCDARVVHNTLYWATPPALALVVYQPTSTNVAVLNNLVNSNIDFVDGAPETPITSNIQNAQAGWFVSPATGDLRLSASDLPPVNAGVDTTDERATDIDGESVTDGAPDVGADEL